MYSEGILFKNGVFDEIIYGPVFSGIADFGWLRI